MGGTQKKALSWGWVLISMKSPFWKTPHFTPIYPAASAPQEGGKGVWCKGGAAGNKYMAKMEAPSMIPAWLLFSQL